jgi:hypothetical protein
MHHVALQGGACIDLRSCDFHALQALPFVIETPSQRKLKAALDARLKEIEDALEVFSQPNVLVEA